MRKIDEYGNFFILCSCEATNKRLAELDGKEFHYLSEAVEFMLDNKEEIAEQGDKVCIMVWREIFSDEGKHLYNDCVDEIYLNDIYQKEEHPMKKFNCVVHYEGAINYEVEAKDEVEAREIAEEMFGDEPAQALSDNFGDFDVDCWEIKED